MEHDAIFILIFSIAGACGTLARYGLNTGIQRLIGQNFPWGIFIVNILGCFLFGLVWAISEQKLPLNIAEKNAILLGFLGSLTTFSTLIFDTHILMRKGIFYAFANVIGQILLGLGAFVVAMALI